MNKYRVYCEVDGWIHVIADAVPVSCPNDTGSHTLRISSAVIVEKDIKENPDGLPTQVSLDNYRTLKANAIDRRSEELIAQGFEFPPASGKIFSLSESAQTNILALDNTRDDPALVYPINYNTIDDLDSYDVPDSATLHNMYLTALSTKKGHLDSGTVLKAQVRAAIDEAGVDLVIDNR